MSGWVLLRNESELETKAKALRRKCRGHYYTNYYFLRSTRDDDLRYTELFYLEDGDNLYAIERKDDYYQLFYFVGDADRIRLELPPSVENGVLTCEIDEEERKEKQGPILERLYQEGFGDYKRFHYYDRKRGAKPRRVLTDLEGFDPTYHASVEELSVMYDIFDPYSYDLPIRRVFPEWLETMDIVSCAVDGKYAGSSMSGKSGWGSTYIFVRDDFRGVGGYLFSADLDRRDREHPNKIQRTAIEDDNIRSIRLHRSFGYEVTDQYHQVLIRRK